MISPELLQAYRETDYIVVSDETGGAHGRFTLTVGIASLPLMSLYKRHDARCAAFITAFNPHGRRETESRNQARQARLRSWIQGHDSFFLQGTGRHSAGIWPGGPSFLILAMPLEQASTVGRLYNQNAIVWCDHDAAPQLILQLGRASCRERVCKYV